MSWDRFLTGMANMSSKMALQVWNSISPHYNFLRVLDGSHTGYNFNGDPMEVFELFFGTVNPFHIALDNKGQQVPMIQKIESDLHKDYVTDESIKEDDLILNV